MFALFMNVTYTLSLLVPTSSLFTFTISYVVFLYGHYKIHVSQLVNILRKYTIEYSNPCYTDFTLCSYIKYYYIVTKKIIPRNNE